MPRVSFSKHDTVHGRLWNVKLALRTCVRYASVMCSSAGLIACSSDSTALIQPDQTLLRVVTNVRAATLATTPGYDTIRLSATAYRGNGEVIADVVPTYTASNNTLYVTPDGLVTGVKKTIKSYVLAKVTYEGVTQTDTTWITVDTTTPVPLQTFAMSVPNNINMGASQGVGITARDMNNANRSSSIPIDFHVPDNRIATIDRTGLLKTLLPEREVTVYARTMFYGVSFFDSAVVTIGYPEMGVIAINPRTAVEGKTILEFTPNVIYVATGASIIFCNCSVPQSIPNTQAMDVVFDNPEAAQPFPNPLFPTGAGNITGLLSTPDNKFGMYQTRTFLVPGTYTYHSEGSGSQGTIIVR